MAVFYKTPCESAHCVEIGVLNPEEFMEVQMARWRKTPGDTRACAEVAKIEMGRGFIIRNSSFRADKAYFTKAEMVAFFKAVKEGHFDSLIEEKIT